MTADCRMIIYIFVSIYLGMYLFPIKVFHTMYSDYNIKIDMYTFSVLELVL